MMVGKFAEALSESLVRRTKEIPIPKFADTLSGGSLFKEIPEMKWARQGDSLVPKFFKQEMTNAVSNIKNTISHQMSDGLWRVNVKEFPSQERRSMAPSIKEKDAQDGFGIEKMKCRNEHLAGKKHPETGVLFEKRIIRQDLKIVEVVVPRFKSDFNARLDESLHKASDPIQFKECNRQLKENVEKNPILKSKFKSEQLEQIAEGDTPDGYTWHHDSKAGKMQLVDSEVHAKTAHTGGRAMWGGGSEHR